MTIGYTLIGSDNDTFMYDGVEHTNPEKCIKCGHLLDFDYHNPYYRLKRKNLDFSHPYDFGNIISLRFKEFCERHRYNVKFKEFEREPDFYQLIAIDKVEFDHERRKTRFMGFCDQCNNYEEVIGVTPVYLKHISRPLNDGIYRTDLLFGSGDRKGYMVLIGLDTYEKMKQEKFKGLYFEKIEL
jgi:hypothetical protein